MIKREIKVNLLSFIIWTTVILLMFIFVFLIYPFMITDEAIKSIDEITKTMSPELLKSFNMDITSISTAYGWLKSEGFMYYLIIVGLFSSILGGTIVLKEESNKTIEYLKELPIKRKNILTNKIIVAIIYIVSLILIVGIVNYICLILSGEFDQKQYLLLSITPLFIALPLFSINLFISTFLHKTKGSIGIGLGIVFVSYMLSILSELSDNVEFLKYFSIYTLSDVRNVITSIEINPLLIIISFIITIVFIILSYIRYDKKELL